ncbi:hypothetical protein ARMSODRAFT_1025108 [Armillaria solidipes]|uniref:Uncharacterized protein n=1 Tax=Armillaria solidipes TaxID=1076256 RepID=A0A2H3B817_9AGAR|nr:hypothetical protein ARMSODRAFT_1025108 [Armillaria solidipes]
MLYFGEPTRHFEVPKRQTIIPAFWAMTSLQAFLFLLRVLPLTASYSQSRKPFIIPSPAMRPDSRLFMVEMFHELHCLRVLNFAFDRSPMARVDHVHHCLNYLRQMALCSADVTLEPDDFIERNFEGSRTGSVHVCHDWSALYDAMEENWVQWEDVVGDDTSARAAASL